MVGIPPITGTGVAAGMSNTSTRSPPPAVSEAAKLFTKGAFPVPMRSEKGQVFD